MTEDELKRQIAQLDQTIAHWAQQAEQAKANWNYARGMREGFTVMLAKVTESIQLANGLAEDMVKSTENQSQL